EQHLFRSTIMYRVALSLCLMAVSGLAVAQGGFINYDTPQVHPIDISPDGSFLAVCITGDNRVEFYDLGAGTPVAQGSVAVGIDPVTVRWRNNVEVWAVNHISDSVSIIDLTSGGVRATIATLDEPSDVVFAGSPQKAFVSCSQVNAIQV